jgi:phosphohistidine phosphatase SixA
VTRGRVGGGISTWIKAFGPRAVRSGLALTVLATLAAGLVAAAPASGQPAEAPALRGAELLARLRGGGFILYFRHADTDHRQNDRHMKSVEDCATQRILTDQGREHARAIGEAIRALGIPIGSVLASPLCRTVDTAVLAFGTAEREPAAREAGASAPSSPERYAGLRHLLSTVPPKGQNTVIVAHAAPFLILAGGQILDEGQAAVVEPGGGGFRVVAYIGLKEWRELAELPR